MKFGNSVCILNVGGTKYAFPRDVIKDFPLRRVSRLHSCASEKEVLEVCDDYDRESNEFFFDRHSEAFVFIMLYVKSGKLRFVPRMCELSFYNEMVYWGLESSHLEYCCQRRLDDRMSDSFTYFSEEDIKPEEDLETVGGSARWLERMRRTFEEPTSSVAAQILASVSVIFVIVSMVILCASTLPDRDSAKNGSVAEHRITEAVCMEVLAKGCPLPTHRITEAVCMEVLAKGCPLPTRRIIEAVCMEVLAKGCPLPTHRITEAVCMEVLAKGCPLPTHRITEAVCMEVLAKGCPLPTHRITEAVCMEVLAKGCPLPTHRITEAVCMEVLAKGCPLPTHRITEAVCMEVLAKGCPLPTHRITEAVCMEVLAKGCPLPTHRITEAVCMEVLAKGCPLPTRRITEAVCMEVLAKGCPLPTRRITEAVCMEVLAKGCPLPTHRITEAVCMEVLAKGCPFPACRIIEAVCIGWFTAECIVRFLVSRDKCEFLRRPLNVIDLLAIAPYYASALAAAVTGESSQLQRAGVTLRALRMMRIFWLIKLARHFLGLQSLGLTLRRCYREMVMLLVFVGVAMAIFGALAQLLEHGLDLVPSSEDYASIPAACWWVIISMTTVGYGDMYPITMPGRVLGGLCVVSGIVLLALPITFIYHSFVQCYHELRLRSARYHRSLSTEFLN
ncbi:potassium voltage-gated channel subfamily G member 3 isoform X2 [Brienomyrus brachyistius]|uniref:potassium voltage-gated channel subfamily G member 3 isoform X2 n=1 Tax=Brienomyrus brachyistius TaxID=42636 RepID=UPI0020B32D99|nr:potassium voltage-gated channel subfamily G member 3 isoform X2 [Brienomyrus brachyistius]